VVNDEEAGTDASGEPWRCAVTGEAILGHIYRLRLGVPDVVLGPQWALDMRGSDDAWSTVTPLGSSAQLKWAPTADELRNELAEWMPVDNAQRLLNGFRSDFPDVLPSGS